jgi:hypothetical protein
MSDVSGVTVVTNACVYYHYTRGCGRAERPAFPASLLGSHCALFSRRVGLFSKIRAYGAAGSRICVHASSRTMSRPTIRFCPEETGFQDRIERGTGFLPTHEGRLHQICAAGHALPNGKAPEWPSPTVRRVKNWPSSEFRLSAQPRRVYPALFAENGHRHGKTASMTPESYCEAFGRPYLRP